MDQVEEIKQKLDIVATIQEYVPLKKAGVSWKGCCPFHNEKTPSFFVHPDRNFWYCFGCSEGGDIFTFLQKIENIEFSEALKILAQKAGVELKKFDPRISDQKNRLQEICERAARFWQNCLEAPYAKQVRDYVAERKISDDSKSVFKIGYAPDTWDSLLNFLLKSGFNETEIFQAGLIVKKDNGRGYYDRFRHRLMFPIQDVHGNVVGFTGRAMKKEELAKYVNTPEGPLYHKGELLYALDKAKNAIREKDYVIIVEGNMDALACHQAGYKNVVACSGTALTTFQIRLLKRYTTNVLLTLDIDEAGQNATQRTIDLLFHEGMNIKVVKILEGKDPDECLKKNPQAWVESLKNSKPVMQFFIDRYLTSENLKDIYKKQTGINEVLIQFSKLKNTIEQDHWLRIISSVAGVREDFLLEALKKIEGKEVVKVATPINALKVVIEKSKDVKILERIFTILINYPNFIGYAENYLLPETIDDRSLQEFYKNLIIWYNQNRINPNRANLLTGLKDKLTISQGYFDSLTVYVDKIYEGFGFKELQNEIQSLIKTYQIYTLERKLNEKQRELVQKEKDGNHAELEKIIREIQIFSEKLSELK